MEEYLLTDADSICVEPDDHLMNTKGFAGFRHETVRKAGWAKHGCELMIASTHPLIATGTMGFLQNTSCLDWLLKK